jgi:hypothetical protein
VQHILAVLLALVVGDRVATVAELVVAAAIFERVAVNARGDGCVVVDLVEREFAVFVFLGPSRINAAWVLLGSLAVGVNVVVGVSCSSSMSWWRRRPGGRRLWCW